MPSRYPSEQDLSQWSQKLPLQLSNGPREILRRLRFALHGFTKGVIVAFAPLSFPFLAFERLSDRDFFVLLFICSAVSMSIILSYRSLYAKVKPISTLLYLCTMATSRLRDHNAWETCPQDVADYLTLALPGIERLLKGSTVRRIAAGTSVARRSFASRADRMCTEIGDAEVRLRCACNASSTSEAARQLRESLGILIIIALNGKWFMLPESAAPPDATSSGQSAGSATFSQRVLDSMVNKGSELALAGLLTLAAAILKIDWS